MSETITVAGRVLVPRVPNFLRWAHEGEDTIPIHELSDDELSALGGLWTKELIRKARLNRKEGV